ncbi:MAG: phosphopantetheine-binding protein [Xenococcus sp. MO_188.B8]|nr:phosphopantetheine-binding protein [Xenococcus sp. MO_188.B8]
MSTTISTELVSQLKTILITAFEDDHLKVEDIDDNAPLLEGGLELDSVQIVEFISAIEQHFDLEFDDSELDPENFSSLRILADVISRKVDS